VAVVPRKLANGRTAYWVTFQWKGKAIWERVGTDAREAERVNARRKEERKAGTYRLDRIRDTVKVRAWFDRFLEGRTNRTADTERQLMRDHVLSVPWFCEMQLGEVRPRDVERLVLEMRSAGRLGEKSIANVFTIVRGGFRRAVFEEVIGQDPCVLERGTIRRKGGRRRTAYTRAEARQIMGCPDNPLPVRVWLCLAFYTGMREGEICGRRWQDWRRGLAPLGALLVHSQYDDQPLKTDDPRDITRPRVVPVHPELAAILALWWERGFELHNRRAPALDDFIVPTAGLLPHSRSSAYRAFRRALARAGVANRSLHSTRHTFVTVARASADPKLVERITHNADGTTLDGYTHPEWEAMCSAVSGIDYSLDRQPSPDFLGGSDSWTRSKDTEALTTSNYAELSESVPGEAPDNHAGNPAVGAKSCASQDPVEQGFAIAVREGLGAVRPPAKTRPVGYVARARRAR